MVVRSCLYFKRYRMHRNVMRSSGNLAVMATKPPKPPCWRDFVAEASRLQNHSISESEFTDISKIARNSNDSYSSDGLVNNKTGKQKRIRAKIHRTRSQFTIEESDLPEEALTVTLAETKPDDLGLCRQTAFDERILQEDNNRKCQTWLQNIEACKPLEDIACFDISDPEAESVSIEVPDDTCWYDQSLLRTSGSSRQWDTGSVSESADRAAQYQTQYKPLHRTRTVDNKQGCSSGSKGHKGNTNTTNTFSAIYESDTRINTG